MVRSFTRISSLALALLAGCTHLYFEGERIELRSEPTGDARELVLLYDDVGYGKEDREETEEVVTRILCGERFFVFGAWPFMIDLEDSDFTDIPIFSRLALSTRVTGAGAYAAGEDNLGLWQRLRIENWSELEAEINREISGGIAELAAGAPVDPDSYPYDARTAELCRAKAVDGSKWVELHPDGLRVDLPLSHEAAPRLLAEVVDWGIEAGENEKSSDDKALARSLFGAITELSLVDEHLRLRLGKASGATLVLEYADPDTHCDSQLRRELARRALIPEVLPTLAELIADPTKLGR